MPGSDDKALIQSLHEQIAQFRLLADNVPVAIAYYEATGMSCRYANIGYCRMFGLSEQSVIGRSYAEVIGEDSARLIQSRGDQLLQ